MTTKRDPRTNLQPITTSERARELGRRSGAARRERRRKAEELALRDLVPLALRAKQAALRAYLEEGRDVQAALRASDDVLDRSWGRATQRVDVGQADPLASLSLEELRALLEQSQPEPALAEPAQEQRALPAPAQAEHGTD